MVAKKLKLKDNSIQDINTKQINKVIQRQRAFKPVKKIFVQRTCWMN